MVAFNQDVKDIQGDWTKASGGPIKQPHFVSETGMALESGAKLLDSGLKARDQLAEAFITEEARQKIEPMVNQRISDLEATHSALRLSSYGKLGAPNVRVDVNGQPIGVTTPDGVAREVPDEIKNLPRVLQTLKDSRANGTISQTMFDGEVLKVAKDMRSRVMIGDRDLVDRAIAKFKNEPTANEYMQGLLKDINSALTQKNKIDDHITNQILAANERGVTGAYEVAVGRTQGLVSNAAGLKFLYTANNGKYQLDQAADVIKFKTLNKQDSQSDADDYATKSVSKIATDDMAAFQATSGFDDPNSPMYKNHIGPLDPKLANEQATKMQQRIFFLAQKMENEMKSPMLDSSGNIIKDINGKAKNAWDTIGEAAAKKKIDDSLALHRLYIDSLTKGDAAPATYTARIIEDMKQKAELKLYNSSIGQQIIASGIISKQFGAQALPILSDVLTSGAPGQPSLLTGIGKYIQAEASLGLAKIPNPDGTPRTITQAMARAQQSGVPLSPADGEAFVRTIELIKHPDIPDSQRAALVDWIFSDRGLITKLDEKKKYSIYNRLTSDEFVKGVKAAGSQAWDKYVAWNRDTFGSEVMGPDVKELNNVTLPEGHDLVYQNKDGKASYAILNPRGEDITYSPRGMVSQFAKRTVANVNVGLRGLSVVAKANGDDVDEYLFNTLVKLNGGEPVVGMPKNMQDAIIASRRAKALMGKDKSE